MDRKWRWTVMMAFVLLLWSGTVVLAGCGPSQAEDGASQSGTHRFSVVCTLFPQYDFARAIGGDAVDVTMLLDPGTESHTFDPTPADMKKIARSDLFIYTGAVMEGWSGEIVDSLDDSVQVVDLSQCVSLEEEIELSDEEDHDHDHGHGQDHHRHAQRHGNHGDTLHHPGFVIRGVLRRPAGDEKGEVHGC